MYILSIKVSLYEKARVTRLPGYHAVKSRLCGFLNGYFAVTVGYLYYTLIYNINNF
nr:MAG TPA: hypothetical protein [Caudoviricetes sp.]